MSTAVVDETSGRNSDRPRLQSPENISKYNLTGKDRRRSQSSNFGGQLDANQLFLGNLPHSATDDELREIFGEFGTVVDLRVHSKPATNGPKVGQSRLPPNYGFITYDSQQSVMACLAAKPIFYPRNDPNGTKMNVEEKKNKERDGNRPSYGVNKVVAEEMPKGEEWVLADPVEFLEDLKELKDLEIEIEREIETIDTIIEAAEVRQTVGDLITTSDVSKQ
ncbi:hypothetical protein D910_09087 [Dendroctonus ponderosae]|uniref:RRM domain-containing protein n=1 Tax=Dendroctonus ponderosae TaxID=77166 RepID=U4UNN9_DENPD|nr:hypothetical protein D910_09087 [Dendroctonus ponderosae]